MKLRWGPVPDSSEFDPEAEGFVSLREPSDDVFLAASVPVGFALALTLAFAWDFLAPGGWYRLGITDLVSGTVAMIVLHEWIHALTLPDQGAGENTVFGFYPRHLIFYTHYEGPIDRDQFLLTLVSPFVLLSVVPLVFGALVGDAPALLTFVSLLNALGAGADILGCLLVLWFVPKNAMVRNRGSKTWWRPI